MVPARVRRDPGAERLRRLPRFPQGPRPQLHPALALGAVPVPGRRRRFHLCMTPQPWPRTGPGRLRTASRSSTWPSSTRPTSTGCASASSPPATRASTSRSCSSTASASTSAPAPDNVEGHPFHAANNVNGIGITSIVDYQVLPLDPRVQALQEAYIRKVVDTVHDLPNVLYEVANESSGGGRSTGNVAEASDWAPSGATPPSGSTG